MNELGRLVSGVELLAGELHYVVRSKRQRLWLASLAARQGVGVGGDFLGRLTDSRKSANELVQLIQVGLQRRAVAEIVETRRAVDVATPLAMAQRAARKGLPTLPPNLFNNWEDAEMPAARLYAAVMRFSFDSITCAAVGAHGMGGVGKTLACLLVARRIDEDAAGQRRFPDGVYWVQLSQRAGEADVMQRACDLATTLSGELAVANEMAVAVGHLREALQGKSCLVILDDVWEDRWASVFISALRTAARSCLLLSTRRQDIATLTNVSRSVQVDTFQGTAAAGVLMVHAEAGGKVWEDKTDEHVRLAVAACGGLAMALAVMGSLVREHGWTSAVERVRSERDAVFSTCLVEDVLDEYKGSLWACLLASYRALDADEQLLWRARFQALCVVRAKEQLPWTALAALWGGTGPMAVKRIAQTLRDRSLVTLHGEEGGDTLCLSLHDLVVEFLAGPHVMDQEQRDRVHARMVAKYCERSSIDVAETPSSTESTTEHVAVRALWRLPSDGFIERALPRLLCAGGASSRKELLILLFDWRYISWRVTVGIGGCGAYRMDARVYLRAGQGVNADVLDRVATVVEGAIAVHAVPLPARLQQAAWEVTERFTSAPHVAGGDATAPLLSYLCATARFCIELPAVALYAGSLLGLPQERRVFGCVSGVRCLCRVTSAHGDVLLVAGQGDGNLAVWEELSGLRLTVMTGHTGQVNCLTGLDGGGTGGGERVVSGSSDGTVLVWQIDGGQCVAVLVGHTQPVSCLLVLNSSTSTVRGRVVSGSNDGTVRVWEVEGGTCVAALKGHKGPVRCLARLDGGGVAGGRRVASGSYDGTVRVWDVDVGKCVAVLEGNMSKAPCLSMLDYCYWSSGGQVVSVSRSASRTVVVREVHDDHCLVMLDGYGGNYFRVPKMTLDGCGSGGGGLLASERRQPVTMTMSDLAACGFWVPLVGHTSRVNCVSVLDGGSGGGRGRVVSGSEDCTLRVWNVDSGRCVAVLKGHTNLVRCLAVLPGYGSGGGGLVVSGSEDHTVRVWDVEGGRCVATMVGHTGGVMCLSVLDGCGIRGRRRVVSGSKDRTVRVWDVHSGLCVAVLHGHNDWVSCLSVLDAGGSCGRGRVVTGSEDRTLRVWEVAEDRCVAELPGHSRIVTCLSVQGANGICRSSLVVSGSEDCSVRVWEVDGGTCVAVMRGDNGWVNCVSVLDGGSGGGRGRVVSGSEDCTLRVWNVDSGRCVAVLKGHTNLVRCLAVLPGYGSGGGGLVVSGSEDHTVRVWDVAHGRCVATMVGHTGGVMCLSVLDGCGIRGRRRVVSGSKDRTVRVWDVHSGLCVAVLHGLNDWVSCLSVLDAGGIGGRRHVLSGSHDRTVRVWEADGGECVAVMDGHRRGVVSLSVLGGGGSGRGVRVVSGSVGPYVRVWDVDGERSPAMLYDLGVRGASVAAESHLDHARALPSATARDGPCFFVDQRGVCVVLHAAGPLRYIPGPPVVTALCLVSPDRVVFGTRTGRVLFGRLVL